MKFNQLIKIISDTNHVLQLQALKSVNIHLTLRNWLFGMYIVEFEQNGDERAAYGEKLIQSLADSLTKRKIKGLSFTNLNLYRQFYLAYPQISQTLSGQLSLNNLLSGKFNENDKNVEFKVFNINTLTPILQTASEELMLNSSNSTTSEVKTTSGMDKYLNINKLTPFLQTLSEEFNLNVLKKTYPKLKASFSLIEQVIIRQLSQILQTLSEESVPPILLLQRLSFSHFVELMQIDDHWKRLFFEIECIKGTWNVRELKRQINSTLYERIGISKNKKKALAQFLKNTETLTAQDIIRDPNYFEFSGLMPRDVFTEDHLSDALMEHLQEFLLEMGKGFLFEARQKRIQIGIEYYYVDMVLYHRFLRCHVLIELKKREFQYADIAQLNTYLNYYKKYETTADENPPIGILLCTNKNDTLVEFATAGIDNQLFISKYQLALPSKQELQQVIQEELRHLKNTLS